MNGLDKEINVSDSVDPCRIRRNADIEGNGK